MTTTELIAEAGAFARLQQKRYCGCLQQDCSDAPCRRLADDVLALIVALQEYVISLEAATEECAGWRENARLNALNQEAEACLLRLHEAEVATLRASLADSERLAAALLEPCEWANFRTPVCPQRDGDSCDPCRLREAWATVARLMEAME